jgi:hypothetical protein
MEKVDCRAGPGHEGCRGTRSAAAGPSEDG